VVQDSFTQALPGFANSINPAQDDDVLELDELWRFVGNKKRQVWLWIALCVVPGKS
jgi:hypothetical protein